MDSEHAARSLELLQSLSKTMRLMALYQPQHPAFQDAARACAEELGAFFAATGEAEFAVSIDQQSYIVNGVLAGQVVQVPTSLKNFFDAFHVDSVVLTPAFDVRGLTKFCSYIARTRRTGSAEETRKGLEGLGLEGLELNTARYAKVGEEGAGDGPPSASGVVSDEERERRRARFLRQVQTGSVEDAMWELIRRAVPDDEDQKLVYRILADKLKQDLEAKVNEATRALRDERAELQEEVEDTRRILDTMAEGVVTVDGSGNIIMMNEQAEMMTGKKLAEAAGAALLDQMIEGQQFLTLTKDLLPPAAGEPEPERDDAAARILRQSTAIVRDEKGKVVGTMASMPDIVKLRELQRMQQDFVSQVTHELRSPLTAIQSALDLLQSSLGAQFEGDDRRIFDTAVRNVDKLGDLITHILDFSKVESGSMTVSKEPIPVKPVVHEVVRALEPWAKVHAIELKPEIASGLPEILGDHKRLVQVLTNLVSNAIKASEDDTRIAIRAIPGGSEHPGFVLFSVADQGVGIPEDKLERLFEKFFQTGSTKGGAGLGLSIVKNLIEQHGGRIWVSSVENRGTTFYFTVPVSNEPRILTAPVRKAPAAAPAAPAWKRWLKDLLGL